MIILNQIAGMATVKAFLVSLPESLGLLVFGICLVAAAALIRSLLGRYATDKEATNSGGRLNSKT